MDRIVCAAEKFPDGLLILGARHFDMCMHNVLERIPEFPVMFSQGGFINQRGEFLTRTEAWLVAEAAGQIINRVGGNSRDGGTLYSENLY